MPVAALEGFFLGAIFWLVVAVVVLFAVTLAGRWAYIGGRLLARYVFRRFALAVRRRAVRAHA